MRESVLDLFILSLLDRGLETSYALQRRGGLSVGTTIPALKRLEEAGFVRKTGVEGAGKRPRHGYQVSAAGRQLARSAWKAHLKSTSHLDLDAVIRVADMARHYDGSAAKIASFLDAAALERRSPSRLRISNTNETGHSFEHVTMQGVWNVFRLKAEMKFLAGLAKSFREQKPKNPKR